MSSRSNRPRQRRHARTATRGGPHARVVALNAPHHRFNIAVVLRADGLTTEATAHLYWAVQALDPFAADVDEQGLIAHFVRYAATVDVAAWTLIDEVRALPQAVLAQVEAGRPDNDRADLVVTAGELTEPAWRRRAA